MFYTAIKRVATSVVLPPDDSSDSDEGTSTEDEEDELYTQGQCGDSYSSSSDHLSGSSSDEAEEGENQRKQRRIFKWRKKEFEPQSTATQSHFIAPEELSTPLLYFSKFFDEDIFEAIAHQTNLYSCQLIGSSINTNAYEIKAFIGMKLIIGVVKMPAVENYWATDTCYEKVADVMPLRRYKCLFRMLHFHTNLSSDTSEDCLKRFMEIESENQFSIDEMMVPYKGKKGFKIFSTFDGALQTSEKESGLGRNVVLQLCRTIRNPSDCVVYFDNFFTSLSLISHLRESMGLRSLGTIRKSRLKGCKLAEDRDLLQRGRGSFDFCVDNDAKLAVVKWADNKTATLVSSCASVNPLGQVRCYSKEEKKICVPCLKIVAEYNTHIGGVDLADMMISLYRTPMVDIAVNNAWLLHRRDAAPLGQKHQCLKDFRLDVVKGLIYPEKQKRGLPRPLDDMRYDKIDHFPILSGNVDAGCARMDRPLPCVRSAKCGKEFCQGFDYRAGHDFTH
uniref:PiggyBac transposable element-derived protein domain-containing protein n=1 Tax=Stegastes partitus TaxID=144197 RepID=A0A3B4ZUF9_9TELE